MAKEVDSTKPAGPVDRFAHWVICWGFVLALFGAWALGWEVVAIAIGALCVVLGAALDVECQIRAMVEQQFEAEDVSSKTPSEHTVLAEIGIRSAVACEKRGGHG